MIAAEGINEKTMEREKVQFEQNAALLYEITAVDSETSLGGFINPIFPRRRVLQLLIRKIEVINCRVDHPSSKTELNNQNLQLKHLNRTLIKLKQRNDHRF